MWIARGVAWEWVAAAKTVRRRDPDFFLDNLFGLIVNGFLDHAHIHNGKGDGRPARLHDDRPCIQGIVNTLGGTGFADGSVHRDPVLRGNVGSRRPHKKFGRPFLLHCLRLKARDKGQSDCDKGMKIWGFHNEQQSRGTISCLSPIA